MAKRCDDTAFARTGRLRISRHLCPLKSAVAAPPRSTLQRSPRSKLPTPPEACWQFLRKLEGSARRAGRKTVVIADNARYHHASLHEDWRREVAKHFSLHFLPPYSPELNPIERVWKLIRRCCLHNRYFPDLSDVVLAIEPRLRGWARPNATLRRLCSIA